MRAVFSIVNVFLFAQMASLSAQQELSQTGVRVRVTAPNCGLYLQAGNLQSSLDETLELVFGDSAAQCLRADITRLERSQGRSGNAAIGAIMGVVGGAALGAAFQGIANSGWCVADEVTEHCTYGAAISGAIVGGLSGLVAGGLIGSYIKSERWSEIVVPRLSARIAA